MLCNLRKAGDGNAGEEEPGRRFSWRSCRYGCGSLASLCLLDNGLK